MAKLKLNSVSPVKKRVLTAPQTAALDCSVAYSLRRAQLSTYQDFLLAMEKYDIRPSQYAVLVLIRSNPGLTQSAVSVTLGIQKANFVSVMDRLEERGFTERRKVSGDRRSSAIFLTRAGEVFVKKLEASHAQLEAKLALRLGTRRNQQLLDMLHEFATASETPQE